MDSGPSDSLSTGGDGARPTPSAPGALLSQAAIPSFGLTEAGVIAEVNDAFAAFIGCEASALRGREFLDLLADDGLSVDPEDLADSDGPVTEALSFRTADDAVVSCDVHLQRIAADADGAPIAGIVEHSAGDEQATTADSDLRYGKIFGALADAVTDGIIVLDTNSNVQYANPAVERILGYTPEELVGGSKVRIIPDRLRQRHLDAVQRYLDTGEKHINWTYVELPGQHADGYEVPLGISFNDFTYDGDRYFVGLFRDISARKEAEQTLAEKLAQLEAVADLGRRALATSDLDGLFAKATRLVAEALDADYCKVLELDAAGEELLLREGVGWDEGIVGEATVSATDTDSQAGYTLGVDRPVVVEDLPAEDRFDGPALLTDHDVRSGISVAIGPADDPWGILGVHDQESREFADHDVNFVESVATVLATAIERERHEQQLNETVAKLEESNERLEQFAYATSHDLQEPLRMVSSYLQLIERRYAEDLDEDAQEFLDYAVDGAQRMREMIQGLLEYSRVDTSGEPFQPVDLDDVLVDVRQDLRVKIDESDAEIDVGDLPRVHGDEEQLRQVFQNLLSNAIEYSGDEPPRISVSAERVGSRPAPERSPGDAEEGRDRWRIAVSDEGIGIDPDQTDRIFDVFQRLHTREEHEGTGIGLALCQRIVERHGGRLRVDSEPGEGSTFSFTLPAVDGGED